MVISKSNYLIFKTCPKAFWMKLNKPELADLDPAFEKRIEDGKLVGAHAKSYFKDTIDVTSYKDGKLDFENMIGLTNRYLMENKSVIAEASFSVDGLFCSVDLLKAEGDEYDIYEVKATTGVEKEHYYDVAFQKHVLTLRGLKVRKLYILHLNKDYIRQGELNINSLFIADDVTDSPEVLLASWDIKQDIEDMRKVIDMKDELQVRLNQCCKACPFKGYCQKELPTPNVLDINALRGAYDYLSYGVVTYKDVLANDVKLNARQKAQVMSYVKGIDEIIDEKAVKAFLKTIRYPLYHLDFESIQLPIPPADGTWPYEQIPTQYSLHIEYEDGKLDHLDFLGDSIDPRRAIAESLCKNIPMDACVLAYNKTFECSRIQELADLYPDLREHLIAIKDNVVDLIVPFKSGAYYHKDMGGSNSIKAVLPALCPNEPELDYHSLPVVHNGGEAMDIYPKMLAASKEEKERIRDGLLKYCCLDTLAMVKVLKKIKERVEDVNLE